MKAEFKTRFRYICTDQVLGIMSGNENHLTNNQFIRQLSKDLKNEQHWVEFCRRFDKSIHIVVTRECKANGLKENHPQFNDLIRDLVQDVYSQLLDKDCNALQKFIGASEKSIYTYLGIISRNVVSNQLNRLNILKKIKSETSLDAIITIKESTEVKIQDFIQSPQFDPERELILIDEVDKFLDDYLQSKDKNRDKIIFKLYFYEGYSPKEIFAYFDFNLSLKSIRNLISKIHSEMRKKKIAEK